MTLCISSTVVDALGRLRAAMVRIAGVSAFALLVAGSVCSQSLAGDVLNETSAPSPSTEATQQGYWDLPLNVVRVDILDRVFPDRPPAPASYKKPADVPRGAAIAFQFAAMSRDAGTAVVNVSPFTGMSGGRLDAVVRLYTVGTAVVETKTADAVARDSIQEPPEARKAPFEVGEVLVRGGTLDLAPGRYRSFVVDIEVSRDAEPGFYTATVRLQTRERSVDVPFVVEVHAAVAPPRPLLSVAHWFRPRPEDLGHGAAPTWWSEEHWRLIENSGRALRDFGLNTVFTPILDGRYPLIQTLRKKGGIYGFDFSRFDRWVNLFLELGFDAFDGHPVGGRHAVETPPMASYGGVWVRDEATEAEEQLFADATDAGPWLSFLPTFYEALHAHLVETGLTRRYVQCQLDEPRDPGEYRRLTDLARQYLPSVKIKDTINGRPGEFSPLVDIPVFPARTLSEWAGLALERKAQGQSVWFYDCRRPSSPYPDRRLDGPLAHSRLYPWLAYLLGADGYLYWEADIYPEADLQPNGSQNPGHPSGDVGMFYPTQDGLVPGLRMMAFREGLLDHALLALLAKKDKARADAIMGQVARSLTDYERDPAAYRRARKDLLLALDEPAEGP